jgi:hypothetical protein
MDFFFQLRERRVADFCRLLPIGELNISLRVSLPAFNLRSILCLECLSLSVRELKDVSAGASL